jgi:hypothetical protein
MKREKCFVFVTHANGTTTTRTSYDPYIYEMREAKARVLAAADSGEKITVSVIEHVNSRTFETDGHGTVKSRVNRCSEQVSDV